MASISQRWPLASLRGLGAVTRGAALMVIFMHRSRFVGAPHLNSDGDEH